MKFLRSVVLLAASAMPILLPIPALADGCYKCENSPACSYCRYSKDTFDARRQCEGRGCKIPVTGGTTTCPPVGDGSKVCMAPTPGTQTTVAAIPWCSPDQPSA